MLAAAVLAALAAASPPRRVLAWTHEKEAEAAAQLRANPGIFDGIYVGYCGVHINTTVPTRPRLYVTDYYNSDRCRTITEAAKELKIELHMWIDMENSAKTIAHGQEEEMDMSDLIASTVEAAQQHGWAGINFDDESETCPRKDPVAFRHWVNAVSAWATGVQQHGIQFSADVQSLTCSSCSPWPACLDAPATERHEAYTEISELLNASSVARWIEMDTYIGELGYFYDQLDFYAAHVPVGRLGVGVLPNANPTNHDQTIGRFHSLSLLDVAEIDVFKLPLGEAQAAEYFPALWKWKTHCRDCSDAALACWSDRHAKNCTQSSASLVEVRPATPRLRGTG
jgi:hypothetical protein